MEKENVASGMLFMFNNCEIIYKESSIRHRLELYKLFFGITFFLLCPRLFSQTNVSKGMELAVSIANNLQQEGFQSIDIHQSDQTLWIGYENRVYRFDALGLEKVMRLTEVALREQVDSLNKIVFITKRNNIPMGSAVWDIRNRTRILDKKKVSITRKVEGLRSSKKIIANQNPSNFRAELILRPYLTMELGNLYIEDQFIHLIDLRPKLNVYLWKGAHFTTEFILPISNEFKTQAPHWSEVRNRVISFTQQVRLPHTTFLNASVGLFSRNRYGFSAQVGKYFLKDRFLLTGKIGYTGHASYIRYNGREVEKNWKYTNLNYIDYKIGAHYWLPKWNTQLGVEYGKVLFDRTALFFKCTQQFKELELGFFLYKTDEGRNYGLEIGIPIFPKKYWKPKLFSIRPAKKFRYTYLSGFDQSGQVHIAREYQAQGMYENFPQNLNPYFLKNYILESN